jgi:hypothetical protein
VAAQPSRNGRSHRDHQSRDRACVRATWVKFDPDQLDRGIDFYKATILPALEELEGFCSASLLVDRASGRGVSSATYDSVEATERNKEQLDSSEPGHRGSTRRGARGARFRVGDRPPACARDGLTAPQARSSSVQQPAAPGRCLPAAGAC